MKQGMELGDLAKELRRQTQTKRDFRAPTLQTHMTVTDDKTVQLGMDGMGLFDIRDTAHQQLASYSKIPREYYERMRREEPRLLASNVNTWLHRNEETRLVRTMDGAARAFLSPRYRTIDNYDVAEAVLAVLQLADCKVVSSNLTDSHLYLKAVSQRFEAKVVGEVVKMGVVISNSEIGHGSAKVEPFMEVLSCTNGAIINELATRRYHIGRRGQEIFEATEVFKDETLQADDKALMLKLRDTVNAALSEAKMAEVVQRAALSAGRKLTIADKKPLQEVVELVGKRLGLNEDERGGVLLHLAKGEDLSAWGLSNAVTRHSQDVESYQRATELERIGGELLGAVDDGAWARLQEA